MFKALLLSLALTGSTQWQGRTEPLMGFVCPSAHSAERVASIGVGYVLMSTLERSNCIFLAFNGTVQSESVDFGIGDHIFSFLMVDVEGHTVYLLNDKGEGFVA